MGNLIFNLLLLLSFSFLSVSGQKDASSKKHLKEDILKKSFSLFDSDNLLEVTLSFDLSSYVKKKFKVPLDGIMTFRLSEKDSLTRIVHIRNRGTFRSSNCYFPPLEITFKKAFKAYPDLGKITKLKLVTRCESGTLYDEYVLREYLIYKLFNVMTDTSFRVRLIRTTFIDSKKSRKPISQYGFFIEPKEIVAERTNSILVKSPYISQKHIVPEVMDRVAIFNYMISNYDWSLTKQHNVIVTEPLSNNPSGLGLAIPYDFDGTGVVNAEYAVPSIESGLSSIRERTFQGICRTKEVFRDDLKKFLNRKTELYRIINDFPYLDQGSKKDITHFLNGFFDQIEKQSSLDRLVTNFTKNCKEY